MADLELSAYVFTLPRIQVGTAASSSTANQQAARATEQASSKGKEKEMEPEQPPHEEVQQQQQVEQQQQQDSQQREGQQDKEQPTQQEGAVEVPILTEQQAQNTIPPRQEAVNETSVLQTPQKKDVSRKRDRETPLTTSISHGEKRHRMNPLSEEEMPIGQCLGMGPPSLEASASSFQQEQERTVGGEVSSSSQ